MSGKLKEVKTRIASVKSTQQITKAMKLVAASKLKKATDAIVQMRPYADKLGDMLGNIVSATEGEINLELANERPEINNVLIVVITSDKGLCGAFNTNVIKQAAAGVKAYDKQRQAGKLSIMPFGKKGMDFFKKYENVNLITDYVDIFKGLSFENAAESVERILEDYTAGTFDVVKVAYAEFRNPVVQNFQLRDFLPIARMEQPVSDTAAASKSKADYIFEPSKDVLLRELAPKILKTQFYSYLLDSNASEHGARMTAMESATENANELLRSLKLTYNRARQAAITTEITEIVSGAAALQGN